MYGNSFSAPDVDAVDERTGGCEKRSGEREDIVLGGL
jgi:hypothetical protein